MTRTRTRRAACVFLVAALCAGCSVGPDYTPPEAPLAEAWIDATSERVQSAPADHTAWWSVFEDRRLTELIERALGENLTLRAAGMRIVQSRAARGIARGNFFPQLQEAFGAYSRSAVSKETSFTPLDRYFDNWSAGFDASWELDVWGKFRRALESANAELDASVADFLDVQVLLVAEVGVTYIDVRTFQERLRLARENVRIQQETFELARTKFEGGAVSQLDVEQAETNLRRTEALIPVLETGLRQANNSLCVLLAMPPRNLLDELGKAAVPSVPQTVAVGVPADVLRQRPDIRRSERLLASQSARIGIAKADFFPRLRLSGTIGYEAENLSDFGARAFFGSIGPSFRWNILNYGRIQNAVRSEAARFEELVLDYENLVLLAQREAEDALTEFLRSLEEVALLRRGATAAANAVEIGTTQYRGGLVDFNRVFLLQTELVSVQDRLATAEGNAARSLVTLFKALGGGWSPPAHRRRPSEEES